MQKILGLTLGLAGSIWSLKKAACPCKKEQAQLPEAPVADRKTLGALGVLAYSALLAGQLGNLSFVNSGIKAVALVHALLILVAIKQGKLCPSCLTAAGGAFLALTAK